jgi:hypothetical protein
MNRRNFLLDILIHSLSIYLATPILSPARTLGPTHPPYLGAHTYTTIEIHPN